MFQVQRMLDIKRKEIAKLERVCLKREEGLVQSEKLLDEDLERFKKYWEENKKTQLDAHKKAETEANKKQDKLKEIKELHEEKSKIEAKQIKNKETISECKK
jgi:hypothetical protein